jgi:hypothetical protein
MNNAMSGNHGKASGSQGGLLPDGVSPKHPDYRHHLLPAEIGDVEPDKRERGMHWLILPKWGDRRALDYVVGAV